MVPVLPPDTIVLGVRWLDNLKPGHVIIFERENRETIKRIERIDDGRLFVLGDHAETSTDSRHYGMIDIETVMARVVWPRTPKPTV